MEQQTTWTFITRMCLRVVQGKALARVGSGTGRISKCFIGNQCVPATAMAEDRP